MAVAKGLGERDCWDERGCVRGQTESREMRGVAVSAVVPVVIGVVVVVVVVVAGVVVVVEDVVVVVLVLVVAVVS